MANNVLVIKRRTDAEALTQSLRAEGFEEDSGARTRRSQGLRHAQIRELLCHGNSQKHRMDRDQSEDARPSLALNSATPLTSVGVKTMRSQLNPKTRRAIKWAP